MTLTCGAGLAACAGRACAWAAVAADIRLTTAMAVPARTQFSIKPPYLLVMVARICAGHYWNSGTWSVMQNPPVPRSTILEAARQSGAGRSSQGVLHKPPGVTYLVTPA